jgi:translation initiation factor 1
MAKTDWKDLLGALAPENDGQKAEAPAPARTPAPAEKGPFKQDLIIRLEKRNGKPATIVSNFSGSEAELKTLAASLKKHCGTGGSAKDDEILIQGDVRTKVADHLRAQNHRVRGDFKK